MVRLATINDAVSIANIFEDAKEKFANEGTFQWKGKYPNIENFYQDLINEIVIVYENEENNNIVGTATIVFSLDRNYNEINGTWLNNDKYVSIHRIATKKGYLNKGVASSLLIEAEKIALSKSIYNIRIDTHQKNISMRCLLKKLSYCECGEITLLNRNDLLPSERKRVAYQKVLQD